MHSPQLTLYFESPARPRPPRRISEYRGVVLRDAPLERELLDTPDRATQCWKSHVETSPRFTLGVENFVVLMLNSRKRLIGWSVISTGTLDTILVHPREVFRLAIVAGAAAIILMHNHPSGEPEPSEADIKVTRDLIRAGQLLRIEVLDHVVIGEPTPDRNQNHASLRALGYFYS